MSISTFKDKFFSRSKVVVFQLVVSLLGLGSQDGVAGFYRHMRREKFLEARALPYQRKVHNAKLHFLFAGDSSAVGVGAECPEVSVAGWAGKDFPAASIRTIGKSGIGLRDVATLLHRLPKNIDGAEYDVAVIQAGVHEILKCSTAENMRRDLLQVIGEARSKAKNVVLIMGGNVSEVIAFGPFARVFFNHYARRAHNVFRSVSSMLSNVYYVQGYRVNDPVLKDLNVYAEDHFHPNGAGYKLWWDEVKDTLLQNRVLLSQ